MRSAIDPVVEFPSKLNALLEGSGAALLDALMTHVPVGITIARAPDVEIIRVSEAGTRLLQRPRNRLEAIPVDLHTDAYKVSDPSTGKPADPSRLPLTRATLEGEVVQGEEWIVTTEDGRQLTVLCNAGPIRDDQGSVIGGIIYWADMTRQKELEAELRSAIETQKTLLSELQHRVKNHLQIVGSLVRLEGKNCGEEARELADRLTQRLEALSASYSALQQHRTEGVPADEFLEYVCRPLLTSSVKLEIDVEGQLQVSSQTAPVLGIIVNEAVCNALKHGFPDGTAGRLRVALREHEGCYRLQVSDDGAGLHSRSSKGSGTNLIGRLAKQLGGKVELVQNEGAGATLLVTLKRL